MKNKKPGTVIVSALFAVLCLAQTASAFYAPNLQRWVNRDPMNEKGGANLYGFVANDPLWRVDFLGLQAGIASGPADHCQDPWGDAKKKGLDKGEAGGVICCGGQKYACAWRAGGNTTTTKSQDISKKCILEHENDHFDVIDCPKIWCYGWPTRPNNRRGTNKNTEECGAFKIEINCLRSSRAECGGDPQCEKEIDAEIEWYKGN